ncbi:MAG: phage baseplate protein [Aeromonas sp.]
MVIIKSQTFESEIISPEHSSELQDAKMENKKIVADNVRVNAMKIGFNIMYTNKTDLDDYRDKKQFLEDLLYNRETVEVMDSTENIFYGNMVLTSLGGWVFYPNGFSCKVEFTYASITQTATEGQTEYKGIQDRNIKYTERPLKQITLNSDSLPSGSIGLLENMGITQNNGIFNFSALDIDTSNFLGGIGDSVLSTLGSSRLNFSVMANGAMDILSEAGEYLLAGQDLLMNAELLANMIPGVNFSCQLIPMVDKALDGVFSVEKLGKDYELVINEIMSAGDKLGI